MDILNNNSPIGFFDSGVGGLTVLNKVKKILPNESFIFYGDTLHVPYGDKTKAQLLSFSKDILSFFEKKGCKAVVMACNTTSSVIYDDIKDKYPFILYPVVQSVAKILSSLPVERLGVFATKATIESGAYQKEIAKYNRQMQVFGQFCPSWVHFVEENIINEELSIKVIKSDLDKMLLNHPQKIVLGCTHYPFLKDVLSSLHSEIEYIDPAIYLADYIKKDLTEKHLLHDENSNRYEEFYVSSNPGQFKESSKMFFDLDKEPEILAF